MNRLLRFCTPLRYVGFGRVGSTILINPSECSDRARSLRFLRRTSVPADLDHVSIAIKNSVVVL